MTLDTFIEKNSLRPADAIVVNKDFIGLLDHYLIYLGKHGYEHKFIANYSKGVKILSYAELREFSSFLAPNRIKRFIGNDIQREAAVDRALSRKDQQSYHLLFNNCEHYTNYVHTGEDYSQQTKVLGTSLTVAGLATAVAARNNSNAQGVGLLMAGLGLLTLLIDETNNH